MKYVTQEDFEVLYGLLKDTKGEISDLRKLLKDQSDLLSGSITPKEIVEKLDGSVTDMEGATTILGVAEGRVRQLVNRGQLQKITNSGLKPEFLIKDLVHYKYNIR